MNKLGRHPLSKLKINGNYIRFIFGTLADEENLCIISTIYILSIIGSTDNYLFGSMYILKEILEDVQKVEW